MQNFWPASGYSQLQRNPRGWLAPTDDYLRLFLARPELALVPESCDAERRLHASLSASPSRPVSPQELQALQDRDARESYTLFLRFRDGLLAAGTLETYYLGLFRSGRISIPPLFIDLLAQAIIRNVLDGCTDAYDVRAAEMLFRTQRIATQDGQVLDLLNDTGGSGDIGRQLAQARAPLRNVNLQVLNDDNAPHYWPDQRHSFVLDLAHGLTQDLSHGLTFTMTRACSGLKALARVLENGGSIFWVSPSPSRRCKRSMTRPGAGMWGRPTVVRRSLCLRASTARS